MRIRVAAVFLALAAVAFGADVEKLISDARRAFEAGRFKEAAAKYLEASSAEGLVLERVADLALQSAWASYIDGDSSAARNSLKKAFTARPELEILPEFYSDDFARLASAVKSQAAPAPKIDLGELKRSARERLAAGMAQDVLYDLRRVSDSTDPEVHRLTAEALEKMGKADEAGAERKRAAELDSGAISQSPIGALPTTAPAPPPPPAPADATMLISAAQAALGRKEYAAASDFARKAVDADPRSATAHRILGDSALAQNDAATAEREFIASTAINPLDFGAEMGLARLADRAHQPNTAAAHYRRALEINSRLLPAALGLGGALEQAGDRSGARQAYGQATELDPGSAEAHDRYGLFLLGNGETGAAIDQGIEAVRLDLPNAAYHAHLGAAYVAAKMNKEAERELSEAVRTDGGVNAASWNALGIARLNNGNPAGASEAFSKSAAISPADETAAAGLGSSLAALGKWSDAAAALRKGRDENPKSAVIAHDLGVSELALHSFDAAVRDLERAAELDPSSAEISSALARARFVRAFESAALAPIHQ